MWHCSECGELAHLACPCGSTLCCEHAGSVHATPPTVRNGETVETGRVCPGGMVSQRAERDREAIVVGMATVPVKKWDLSGWVRV